MNSYCSIDVMIFYAMYEMYYDDAMFPVQHSADVACVVLTLYVPNCCVVLSNRNP